MEKFVVSARKYRPQNFSTVIGQSHITTTLKNAINNNQLAHAFLFCGPRGVGKTTCARILAKTINCENKTSEGEACNVCNSCTSFDNGSSLNIHELDAASNNSVDDIRQLVEQVRFAPQAGDYKVYIVDEVHMLSAAAFNAFLKTLEEPPPFAIFILATTEKHKIIPTILSRCQIFDFKRITNNDTVEHLQEICEKEDIEAEKTALHVIAQKSEGCMRDALSMMDKIVSFTEGKLSYSNTLEHLNILDEDYFFKMLTYMRTQKLSEALLLFDTINSKGFEPDTFLDGFTEFIRNILVSMDKKAISLLEVADEFRERYLQAAEKISAVWLIAALNLLNDAHIQIRQSRNKKLFVEMLLIKLCYLDQAVDLVDTGSDILKKKIVEVSKPVAFKGISFRSIKETAEVEKKETKKSQATAEKTVPVTAVSTASDAKLSIQTEKVKQQEPAESSNTAVHAPQSVKKNLVKKLRDKIAQEEGIEIKVRSLTSENLEAAWNSFIEQLTLQKNKVAVTNFKMAKFEIENEEEFIIVVPTSFIGKIIEAEKVYFADHLLNYFNNNKIKYKLRIEQEDSEENEERPLTKREQFEILAENYPMLRTFREKLKLDVDF